MHLKSTCDRVKLKNGFGLKHETIWFTEGSKTNEAVGAGCYEPRSEDEYLFRLEGYNAFLQAEVCEIKECVRLLSGQEGTG